MPDRDPSTPPSASDAPGGFNMTGGELNVGRDFVAGDKHETTIITEERAYDVRGLPNPYLGLSAFKYEDAAKYAGREKLIREWVMKITAVAAPIPLLFVTGASGSGKSSFAQAGLLPALEKHYAGFTVKHAVMRPAGDPFAGLNDALWRQLRLAKTPEQTLGVFENPKGLFRATPPDQINVLVIDQFEEFFTQSPQTAREQFFTWLANLPPFGQTRTHIIATMRADYLPELFNHPALYEIAKRGVDLRAMSAEELREAIQQPLRASPAYADGKRFEPALVDKLAEDAAQNAAYLPLLQVTLEELWRKGSLKYDAYSNLTDAIKQRADQVLDYRDFDDAAPDEPRGDAEQTAMLDLLLDLVDVSPGDDVRRDVRRQRTKRELTDSDPERERWLQQLAAARLLSVQQDGQDDARTDASSVGGANPTLSTSASSMLSTRVDLIHETLLTNWTRLQKAIDARRSELRRRARFEQNLDEWLTTRLSAQNRSDDYLLEGVRLAEARELEKADDVALRNEDAKAYLRASVARAEAEQQAELERERQRAEALEKSAAAEKQRGRILRIAIGVVSLLALLAVGAAIFAFLQQSAAIASATEARARLLVAQGDQVFEDDPLLGLRLGLEGLALASNLDTDTQNSMLSEVSNLMKQGRAVRLGSRAEVMYSDPLSVTLVIANADAPGEVRRWSDGSLLTTLRGKVAFDGVDFSPDTAASTFVVSYNDEPGELRRTSDGGRLAELAGRVSIPNGVVFSPDAAASTFVVRYEDAPAEVRRWSDGERLVELAENDHLVYLSMDAATNAFVVSYENAPAELRRTSDGGRLAELAGKVRFPYGVVFSPDAAASTFVVRYENAPAELRRTKDGKVLAELAGSVSDVSFSPDTAAGTFVVSYSDAPAELRRTSDGERLAELAGNNPRVYLSTDAAASTFVVSYENAPAELRRTSDGTLLAKWAGNVSDASFSPDAAASTFVVSYENAPTELRRTSDGEVLAKWAGDVTDVFFSPDAAASTFVVSYYDAPAEVRRWSDGERLAELAGNNPVVYFSTDAAASTFVVYFGDAPAELRSTSDGTLLANLGLSTDEFLFDSEAKQFAFRYTDGRAYLLDLDYLREYINLNSPRAAAELTALACEDLFGRYPLAEGKLKEYLGDAESQVCK